jgi:3-deoxy-manno-octulosonate cytidylyltransferase (CMP-KDO synthetase)
VIPARMSGTRLPGKPLIQINGNPMIFHVWQRCLQVFPRENIYIATEDQVIVDYCSEVGIQVVNTGPANSAIDRLKLFADLIPADTYINVQGDEPIINPEDIVSIANYAKVHSDRVVFGKTAATEEEFYDVSKAKVACALDGKLLYSSRAGIPLSPKGKFVKAERAIWVYAFPKDALDAYFAGESLTSLDKIEDNEIIRFLEIGVDVYCTNVIGDSWAVDEPKDIEVVESRLRIIL